MSATILIVGGHPATLAELCGVVAASGHAAATAPSPERGVERAVTAPPDLVLVDLASPGGPGLEAVRRFKAEPRLREIPLIAVTELHGPASAALALHAGCIRFVTKPVTVEALEAALAGVLDCPWPETGAHLTLRA